MPGAPCKAYIYMTSTVQRGRGWVVVGGVGRLIRGVLNVNASVTRKSGRHGRLVAITGFTVQYRSTNRTNRTVQRHMYMYMQAVTDRGVQCIFCSGRYDYDTRFRAGQGKG